MTQLPRGIRETSPGHYQARYSANGVMHKGPGTFTSVEAAEAWLASVKVDRHAGVWVDPHLGAVSFRAWAEWWVDTHLVNLRESSAERDRGYLARYVLPEFGDGSLADVTYDQATRWVAALQARGLADATVCKAGHVLGKIMDSAVKAGRLGRNSLDGWVLPQPEPPEMHVLDHADIARLATAMDERYRHLVYLGCYSGLRIGEMVALTVGDVDFAAKRIRVTKTTTEVAGRLVHGPPKTKRGTRSVPILPMLADELAPVLDGEHPDDLVVESPRGGPMRLAGFRNRIWKPAKVRAGLPDFRVHDMRHTAVSLWIAAGADPKRIAAWAGHASVVTVFDRYGHLFPEDDDPALARLDKAARKAHGRPRRLSVVR